MKGCPEYSEGGDSKESGRNAEACMQLSDEKEDTCKAVNHYGYTISFKCIGATNDIEQLVNN